MAQGNAHSFFKCSLPFSSEFHFSQTHRKNNVLMQCCCITLGTTADVMVPALLSRTLEQEFLASPTNIALVVMLYCLARKFITCLADDPLDPSGTGAFRVLMQIRARVQGMDVN